MFLPRRVKEGEYISSWWGVQMDMDIFAWIESGFNDDQDCAIVRVTLYAPPSFWIEHGIELALRHESLLARPLRVAVAAAAKWAREASRDGEEQVPTRVEGFSLIKMWDKKAMWYMLPLFVCEGLNEEVYTLKRKAKTWDELKSSLRLRFPEDGIEGQRGECSVPPVASAPSQAEISGLQRQVGALEERLAWLEEARRGKRKVSEDSPSKPTGQGERGVERDDQESPLSKGAPKRRAGVQASDKGKGAKEEQDANMTLSVIAPDPKRGLINVTGRKRQKSGWWSEHWVNVVFDCWGKIGRTPQGSKEKGVTGKKGKLEPLKLTKAQRKARNIAQGGQGTEKGQSSQQAAITLRELESEAIPRGPPLIEQALHGQWAPCNQMSLWPTYNPYMPWTQSNYMSPLMNMMPRGPPPVQIQPVGPLWPPIQQVLQDSMTGGRGQRQAVERGRGDGGRGSTGRGDGGRGNGGRGNDRQGVEGRDGSQRNHKWGSKRKGA
ncbi:hypothetical protein CBR_g61878 [Chara braunii]|uniref:Uncharacterized protein n=1 Tax=Chara braunii TaxID=69332 RepID=A0A388MFK4_CHABU|nr:hypothetical protein CBR_g61878 [Chara braunii]|eukprot:GBG93252.1 hypothetical protein CBR_g61878 [Chara braunii]